MNINKQNHHNLEKFWDDSINYKASKSCQKSKARYSKGRKTILKKMQKLQNMLDSEVASVGSRSRLMSSKQRIPAMGKVDTRDILDIQLPTNQVLKAKSALEIIKCGKNLSYTQTKSVDRIDKLLSQPQNPVKVTSFLSKIINNQMNDIVKFEKGTSKS